MDRVGYHLLEHPADIGVRAFGPDPSMAFAQAVAGLGRVLTGTKVQVLQTRPVEMEAPDLETLLVALLDQCLFHVDAEGWIPGHGELVVDLAPDRAPRLKGTLQGEPWDRERHTEGTAVKAVTWHHLSVISGAEGTEVIVFLDI